MTEDQTPGTAPAPDPATPSEEAPRPGAEAAVDTEPEMTLQEEFAELTPELKQAMFGKPVQQLTALIIGAVLLLALLVGFTALSRNGVVGASPSPSTSPAGQTTVSGSTA